MGHYFLDKQYAVSYTYILEYRAYQKKIEAFSILAAVFSRYEYIGTLI